MWTDFTEAIPAFVTLLATPLTFSIATGLSLGLISYTLVKVAAGKFREVSPVIWILTVLFIFRYVYLAAEYEPSTGTLTVPSPRSCGRY